MSDLGVWAKPTLVGELVTLRPYEPADADAAWEMVNDPEGNDLTGTTATFTREQIEEWVASRPAAPGRLDLAIVENATGEFAGEAVINEYSDKTNTANFRIALRGPAWYGRRLGGEATALIARHAFDVVGLDALTLEVRADNERAIRAYARAGFVETGRFDEDGHSWIEMELRR